VNKICESLKLTTQARSEEKKFENNSKCRKNLKLYLNTLILIV